MRRTLIAVSVALAGLSLPAPARASVLDTYQRLAARELSPAPLVPTTVPSTSLVWVEGGVVYSISSGTPKKVSLAQLRATARGLDRLERDWFGGSSDPDSSSGATAVTTRRTVTVHLDFEASCAPPGSSATTVRAGQADVTLLRRQRDSFSFEIAEHRRGTGEWAGTVTGTIAPSGITLNLRATGTVDGDACDSGPITLTLDQRLR